MRKDSNIKKKASYLIGDSVLYGKNQCISKSLRYHPEFETENEKRINDAINYAQMYGYNNIRLVTCYYVAITIKTGIIEWVKTRETIKPFTL